MGDDAFLLLLSAARRYRSPKKNVAGYTPAVVVETKISEDEAASLDTPAAQEVQRDDSARPSE